MSDDTVQVTTSKVALKRARLRREIQRLYGVLGRADSRSCLIPPIEQHEKQLDDLALALLTELRQQLELMCLSWDLKPADVLGALAGPGTQPLVPAILPGDPENHDS